MSDYKLQIRLYTKFNIHRLLKLLFCCYSYDFVHDAETEINI